MRRLRLVHFKRVRNTGEPLPDCYGHSHVYVNPADVLAVNGGRNAGTTLIRFSSPGRDGELVLGEPGYVAAKLLRRGPAARRGLIGSRWPSALDRHNDATAERETVHHGNGTH